MKIVVAAALLSMVTWAKDRPGAGDLSRGDLALRKHAYVEAAHHYLRARAADPKNPAIYRRLASVAERAGSLEDADSLYGICARLNRADAECRRGSARVGARLKKSARR